MTTDMKEAAEYIESLPDFRRAEISVGYSRLEDRRRKITPPEKHKSYFAWIRIDYSDEECKLIEQKTHGSSICKIFKSYKYIEYEDAIKDVITQLKIFIDNPIAAINGN